MSPVALSRWTMLYFATALGCFLAAQLLMAAGATYPLEPLMNGRTLVGLHLVTIGWLTLLIVGALLQFVPVITGTQAIAGRAGLPSLLAIVVGLCGMIMGFLSLSGDAPSWLTPALPLGGGCVVVGLLLVGAIIARSLVSARPLPLPGRFIAVGLGFLALTIGLGLCFALAFAWPNVFPWRALLAHGLGLHIMSGLAGWLTLTAMGVTYRLLSMFMLAPEDESRFGAHVLSLAAAGLALLWFGTLFGNAQILRPFWDGGAILLVVATILYLADMARMYRARRRRVLELNSKVAAAALAMLAVCVVAFLALEATGKVGAFSGPLGYLLLFGWLSGLALGQLYKIVPFLTWLERYGPQLGKGTVPRVQDLVVERRAAPWFVLYFSAVALGTIGGCVGLADLWRAAVFLHLVASIFIIRELWRARRLRYVGPASSPQGLLRPQPLPPSTTLSA